jgi:hypothetical protein
VTAQYSFFSKSFCKTLVTNFWSWLSQEWVGDSTMPWNLKYLFGTWLHHWLNKPSIWTTRAMDWVAINSQRSDLSAVPTKACCFNTSTNHLVLGAHLTFFYKNNRPIFQTCQNLRFSIFQTFQNCQVSPKNQWLFDFLKCVCGQWVTYQKKLGVWVFFLWERRLGALRTAVIPWSSLLQVQEWSTYT